MARWKKIGSGCNSKGKCDVQYERGLKSTWRNGHETLKKATFYLYMGQGRYMSMRFPQTATGPSQFRGRKGIRVSKIKKEEF